jgi:hypothetical protein
MKTIFKTEELKGRTRIYGSLNNPVTLQLIKINKAQARELYNSGYTIFLHPCRMRLNNHWQSPLEARLNEENTQRFDTLVNSFEYYNCDNERGKYPNYFAVLSYAGENKYQISKDY